MASTIKGNVIIAADTSTDGQGNVTTREAGTLTVAGGTSFTTLTLADGAARTIEVADNATANATAANNLTVEAGSKTAGTGNGGNLVLNAGASSGGTAGTITIGAVGSAVAVTPATTFAAVVNANGGIAVDTTNFTVSGTTGAVHTAGDFDVATNKFTVASASGNTAVGGTLGVTGAITATAAKMTASTMTETAVARVSQTWSRYSWTNAMVVALGAVGNGTVQVCTLPAKTVVHHAFLVVDTQATFAAGTLTASVGPTGTLEGFILNSDIKAAANTVYGNASAELGSLLWEGAGLTITPFYLPSLTATTNIQVNFITGAGTLDGVTTCTGSVYLLTSVLP